MATGPSWLHIMIRVNGRPLSWLDGLIASKTLGTAENRWSARRVYNALLDLLRGRADLNLFMYAADDTGTKPSGSVVCTQANAAGDTVTFTFGGRTITLTEGASGTNGFLRGADNTACGANLATAINSHPVLGGILAASNATGTVTLTGKLPGRTLLGITLGTSDATAFALTQLTGGTPGAASMFVQHVQSGRAA